VTDGLAFLRAKGAEHGLFEQPGKPPDVPRRTT
jgi:hypothetical protein